MATMGGNEGKFSTNLYRILKQKGYTPQNFRAIVMPSNLIKKEMPAEKYESVIENGKKEAANFAYNILSEERNWKPNPVVTGVYNLFMQSNKWYTLLKMWRMRFDNQKCTKCGLCAKLCPVGNIKMNEYPVYGKECVVCLRCFGNCPVKAISIGKTGFIQYHSQSASQLLSE
jgi:ferredoxin